MNILLIIPNLDFGGAQRSFTKLSKALSPHHTIYLVVFNKNNGVAYEYDGELIDLEITQSDSMLGKVKKFLRRIKSVRLIKKQKNIDVSISFLEGADFVNILSKRKEKIIISVRGSKLFDETIQGALGFLRTKILIPLLYQYANYIVSVNHGIVSELTSHFKLTRPKHLVIYNAYDIEVIEALASEKDAITDSLSDKPYLVFSGRLAIEKGIDKLLTIYQRLNNQKKVRFVIIGSGPQEASLFTQCKKLNLTYYTTNGTTPLLESEVVFLGEQKNPFKFISKSLLFMMASSSEGFPNALAEAMICGAPVISTDCPWGPREILAKKETAPKLPITQAEYATYGILMPQLNNLESTKESTSAWVKTLDNLIDDSKIRASYISMGKLRVNSFSLETNTNQWLKAIEE